MSTISYIRHWHSRQIWYESTPPPKKKIKSHFKLFAWNQNQCYCQNTVCRIKLNPSVFYTLRGNTSGFDLLACTNAQGLWSKIAIYSAWWKPAGVALCFCPRAEASVLLSELLFSHIVHLSVCVPPASQMNMLGDISKHFQDAQLCSMCVPGLQDKLVRWVPWDLLSSWTDFWFLTPVRLPVAQTAGMSEGHLGGAFSLLAAAAVALGPTPTGTKSDLHPPGSGASFSPLWLTGCALTPWGATRQLKPGMLVCLTCSFCHTQQPVPDWLRSAASLGLLLSRHTLPCAYCFLLTEEIVKKEGNITQTLRPKSHQHKDESQSLLSCTATSAKQWFALHVTENASPYKIETAEKCLAANRAPLWTFNWGTCAEASLSDQFVSSFSLVSKKLSNHIDADLH